MDDLLEQARLAATPAQAMHIEDLQLDWARLSDAMASHGVTLDELPGMLDDYKALREHVAVQPFDVSDDGAVFDELTPGAFAEWLDTLNRLAA